MNSVHERAMAWLSGDDTGASSKALCRHMLGLPAENFAPSDGDDLGRCLRLLDYIPEWRPRIGEMAAVGACWAALVPHWDELRALLQSEAGDKYIGSAPKTYARIQTITRDAKKADGWISFGKGSSIRVGR